VINEGNGPGATVTRPALPPKYGTILADPPWQSRSGDERI